MDKVRKDMNYEKPTIEVIKYDITDVIRTSKLSVDEGESGESSDYMQDSGKFGEMF